MLSPLPLVNELGMLDPVDRYTVVVTLECVELLPLAITTAITPPAIAPPMIGSSRLIRLMIGFS
jgi:hypothetical protein